MTFLSPVYAGKILILQLLTVVFFSLALSFFLYSMQEKKRVHRDLVTIASQRQKLQQTRANVDRYNKELETNRALKMLKTDPSWEQVEFKWKSIDFSELLRRTDSLYHQQKIFVMESFEAGLETPKDSLVDSSPAPDGGTVQIEAKERFYRLRGYFLCPCL